MIVDVHCHLEHKLFDKDRDEVVEKARKAGVSSIITNGIDPSTNRACLELAKKYDIVNAALGVYPRSALRNEYKAEGRIFHGFNVDKEIELISKNKKNIVAIGEVGLDYASGADKEQKQDFKKMIALSEDIKKPIIVHSRKAENDVIECLESSTNKKIIMHCFSGRKHLVKRIIDNGWCFSIPTHVVRSEQMQYITRECPISKLFSETDAPYLSPFPGKRNEPGFVVEAVRKIAEIKGLTEEETLKNIYMNYRDIFG